MIIIKAHNDELGIGVAVPEGSSFNFYAKGGDNFLLSADELYEYPNTRKEISNKRFNRITNILKAI